ncbi:helix-turn-helix domain-containing protein [Rodentibacter pneumotropicus]|uniref:XRE family transcriptional regulator n=1 Tax=Rodentibacter pneumotropicus TaxID=758 RepID=A0A4S2PZ86_9PAST|nr:helix-turn-helix transcriptional regulator [Rodentibacter pneumotropicus]THA09410.1 XRE family transcriptional regulator [Rodentibacter pneumotropicus]THA18030.1 XRE family transcriptional regulator [Rodentibacter pneumotropicus]
MIEEDKLREAFSARLKSTISAFLKRENREVRGINTELAKVADVSPRAVNKWLNSEAMPSLSNMYSLSNFLGVTPEWLVFGVEVNNRQGSVSKSGYPLIDQTSTESAVNFSLISEL